MAGCTKTRVPLTSEATRNASPSDTSATCATIGRMSLPEDIADLVVWLCRREAHNLSGAAIPYQVTDRNMSVLEGSITAIQVRILVPDERVQEARDLLVDAELGNWLKP